MVAGEFKWQWFGLIRQFTYWNTSTQVVLCVYQSYSEWIGLEDVEIVHISWIGDFRNFTPT